MKKLLVLVSGLVGTGKTYMSKILSERYDFEMISPDKYKETLWDRCGFSNKEEKEFLNEKAWISYYNGLSELMNDCKNVISDYPFSNKQREKIATISNKHNYIIKTIRLTGDLDILYDRQKRRDLDENRHLGHIVNEYKKSNNLNYSRTELKLMTKDEYIKIAKEKGYDSFFLGELLIVDVSEYNNIDYSIIYEFLEGESD